MGLIGKVLLWKQFAFFDVLKGSTEADNIAICFCRKSELLIEITVDLLPTPKRLCCKFFDCNRPV